MCFTRMYFLLFLLVQKNCAGHLPETNIPSEFFAYANELLKTVDAILVKEVVNKIKSDISIEVQLAKAHEEIVGLSVIVDLVLERYASGENGTYVDEMRSLEARLEQTQGKILQWFTEQLILWSRPSTDKENVSSEEQSINPIRKYTHESIVTKKLDITWKFELMNYMLTVSKLNLNSLSSTTQQPIVENERERGEEKLLLNNT